MKKELRILVILIAVLLVGTVGYYLKDYPKKEKRNQFKPVIKSKKKTKIRYDYLILLLIL